MPATRPKGPRARCSRRPMWTRAAPASWQPALPTAQRWRSP